MEPNYICKIYFFYKQGAPPEPNTKNLLAFQIAICSNAIINNHPVAILTKTTPAFASLQQAGTTHAIVQT